MNIKNRIVETKLGVAQNVNMVIYSIRSFKPLGRLISEEWYVRSDIKAVLTVLVVIWRFLADLFGKLFYFVAVICAPNLAFTGLFEWNRATLAKGILWTFFFMNCMLGSFVNSHITSSGDKEDYLVLILMRISPKEHYLMEILVEYTRQFVYYTLFLAVTVCGLLKQPVGWLPWLMTVYLFCRFLGEAVRLKLNDKYGMPYQDVNKHVTGATYSYNVYMFLLAYLVYPVLTLVQGQKNVYNAVVDAGAFAMGIHVILLVAALVGAVFAVRYLWRYPDYTLIAKRFCNLQKLNAVQEAQKQTQKASYELQDKEVKEEELQEHLFENKTGYDYLNAIFFHRHKRLVRNIVRMKVILVGAVLGIAAIALIIAQIMMSTKEYSVLCGQVWSGVNRALPVLVFIMYCCSSGENLIKAMFFECDASLLKYGYYRSNGAIHSCFRIRLKYMLRTELPTVGVFCGGILLNMIILRQMEHWLQILEILLSVCMLTVFFSMFFLCIYYIFQPFTEDGGTVGIGYKICTMGVYLISYSCLQLDTPPAYFALLVLLVTVVILMVGFLLAWTLAPKTFHLK